MPTSDDWSLPPASPPPSFIASLPKMAPAPTDSGRVDRIAGVREISRRLRTEPDEEMTLQYVVDQAVACTGAEAGIVVVHGPEGERTVTAGEALGAGPRLRAPLRANDHVLGYMEVTRMSGAASFDVEDHSFIELVAEYLGRATAGVREGSALDPQSREFVNSVSEELHSPLASVSGLLNVLLKGSAGKMSKGQLAHVKIAAEQNEQIRALAENLQILARLRTPRPRELETISIGPWLEAIAERHRPAIEKRGLRYAIVLPEDPIFVKVVPELLEHAVDRMLDNAVKFSRPDGRVDLSCLRYGGAARVTVDDDGLGFEQEETLRIFERFYRGVTAETSRIPGAGLGLAVVHEIVSVHDGRTSAETDPGGGARIRFSIPSVG